MIRRNINTRKIEMIQRNKVINVRPTPKELAFEFCEMDASEQAMFFNEIHKLSTTWVGSLHFQLREVSDAGLTTGGRSVMGMIGKHADHATDHADAASPILCECGTEWKIQPNLSAYDGEIVLVCTNAQCRERYYSAQDHFHEDDLRLLETIKGKAE